MGLLLRLPSLTKMDLCMDCSISFASSLAIFCGISLPRFLASMIAILWSRNLARPKEPRTMNDMNGTPTRRKEDMGGELGDGRGGGGGRVEIMGSMQTRAKERVFYERERNVVRGQQKRV